MLARIGFLRINLATSWGSATRKISSSPSPWERTCSTASGPRELLYFFLPKAPSSLFNLLIVNSHQRFGNAIVSTGTLNLRHSSFANDFTAIEADCTCPCCRPEVEGGLGITRAYIYHVASKETAGAHLYVPLTYLATNWPTYSTAWFLLYWAMARVWAADLICAG